MRGADGNKASVQKGGWDVLLEGAEEASKEAEGAWAEARRGKDLHKMVELLERCHKQAIAKGVPETNTHWRSKGWMDGEGNEKRCELAKQRQCTKRSREPADHEEWKQVRNAYF